MERAVGCSRWTDFHRTSDHTTHYRVSGLVCSPTTAGHLHPLSVCYPRHLGCLREAGSRDPVNLRKQSLGRCAAIGQSRPRRNARSTPIYGFFEPFPIAKFPQKSAIRSAESSPFKDSIWVQEIHPQSGRLASLAQRPKPGFFSALDIHLFSLHCEPLVKAYTHKY